MARYDFVIAGAGLVGLSAALALTRQGVKGARFLTVGRRPGGC